MRGRIKFIRPSFAFAEVLDDDGDGLGYDVYVSKRWIAGLAPHDLIQFDVKTYADKQEAANVRKEES